MELTPNGSEAWLYDKTINISLSQNEAYLIIHAMRDFDFEPWEITCKNAICDDLKRLADANRKKYRQEETNA